ncbi:MAG: hypothetical protein F4110_04940 [Acidimicrobiaceae bacterium]|nr:hypothetical protein [Acidimicrobiaceae bacterium]MXZ99559.1 hypothetical protein [Acidimicrobiaceae bacterium]MYE76260.1 hypothetical protein [Acidimicrobiaceae bacterium]MYE97855.1 hypothetical protein [Acidimicrobiaceae bacterium]MYH42401.1 hypothetical protein [Acidimicrobiaceae bacterium]
MVRHRSEQDPGGSDETAEQAEFRARVREWHDRHVTARSYDDPWRVPLYVDEARGEESFQNGRAWQHTLLEHGWAGLTWPRAHGRVRPGRPLAGHTWSEREWVRGIRVARGCFPLLFAAT